MKKPVKRERWIDLDYWVWCLFTGDDEQSRLWDSPNEVIRDFTAAGASSSEAATARKLIADACRPGGNYEFTQKAYQKLEKLLSKHVSHKKLMHDAEGVWYDAYCKKLDRM